MAVVKVHKHADRRLVAFVAGAAARLLAWDKLMCGAGAAQNMYLPTYLMQVLQLGCT